MHDFEAANCDELELKRGDVVLVVPTASAEDQVRALAAFTHIINTSVSKTGFIGTFLMQDAGWLTGIKESDWLTLGVGAQRGLFPENFTQHLQ